MLLAAIVIVFAGVFVRAITYGPGLVENFANLAGRGSRELLNISVAEAALNSLRNLIVAALIALPIAWFAAGRKRTTYLVLLPIGISPVVFGLVFLVLSGYLPAALSGTWLLVPVVQSLFLIPLSYQVLRPARQSVSMEIKDAAQLDGAFGWRMFSEVEGPLVRKPLSVAAAFVALGSLGRVWGGELPCLRITSNIAACDVQIDLEAGGRELRNGNGCREPIYCRCACGCLGYFT